ncbi:hypothetical protein Acy02nite_40250 [Actinoplanes cyaneus]|uniref:Uncharacterized protein n=1 Tax=Actinoplanes cyaneus TaxID=52696 RepID=A0A919IHY6_9ACTN|nr:hypothetical protein [Actinoplanes cyaneus]MCW2139612.1 hypothetical protein [Actinoplanes cyaneus]GID66144.1 hypothetical protein Acy02nite_40250 [Actinoplanes cyaneus]
MARRSDADAGASLIGMGLVASCLFSLVATVIAVPIGILCAPAFAIYLLVKDLSAGTPQHLGWWGLALLSPLVAAALIWLSSPKQGWLRGRPSECPEDVYRTPEALAAVRLRRRRALLEAYAGRSGLLLASMTVVMLGTLLYADLSGTMHVGVTEQVSGIAVLVLFAPPTLVMATLLIGFRVHDRQPYQEPVTADVVRAAAVHAEEMASRLRADTARMESIAEQVDAVLSGARVHVGFVALCDLHFESFNCADRMHEQYRSAQSSARLLSDILARCQAQCARPQGRREQHDPALDSAGSILARSVGPLNDLTTYGLDRVRTLNSRTAGLKHSIRDNCGDRGYRWYEALEERKAEARGAAV